MKGLKQIRKHLRLSQREVAEMTGLAPDTIRYYECGLRSASTASQELLAEALTCTVEQLHRDNLSELELGQIVVQWHRQQAEWHEQAEVQSA